MDSVCWCVMCVGVCRWLSLCRSVYVVVCLLFVFCMGVFVFEVVVGVCAGVVCVVCVGCVSCVCGRGHECEGSVVCRLVREEM